MSMYTSLSLLGNKTSKVKEKKFGFLSTPNPGHITPVLNEGSGGVKAEMQSSAKPYFTAALNS